MDKYIIILSYSEINAINWHFFNFMFPLTIKYSCYDILRNKDSFIYSVNNY